MPAERIDPKVIGYWRAAWAVRLLLYAGLGTLFLSSMLFMVADVMPAMALSIVAGLFMLMVAGLWCLWAPKIRYQKFSYELSDELLFIRSGVIVLSERCVPMARVQHVDVTTGPLEKMFELATVVAFTAGGTSATISIPGLSPARASALRDRLLQKSEQARRG